MDNNNNVEYNSETQKTESLSQNNNQSTSSSLATSPVIEASVLSMDNQQNPSASSPDDQQSFLDRTTARIINNNLYQFDHQTSPHQSQPSSSTAMIISGANVPPIEQQNLHLFDDNILSRPKQISPSPPYNNITINNNNSKLPIIELESLSLNNSSNTKQTTTNQSSSIVKTQPTTTTNKTRSWNVKLQISEPTPTTTSLQILKKAINNSSVINTKDQNDKQPNKQQQQSLELSLLLDKSNVIASNPQQQMLANQKKLLSDDNYKYVSLEHANASFPVFSELWKQEQVCDIVLKVGGREFPAHRIILCATIPYFYAMFTNDLVEKNQTEIELKSEDFSGIPSLDVEAFEALLNYAYTGTISINSNNVQSLLIGASFLGLINVQQACSDYLKIRLNVTNVLNVKSFAFALGCDTLVQASKRFIHRNFDEISKGQDFLNLDFDEILDVISSDELNINNEKIVFEAVMKWTKHDEDMRQQYLPQLLREVRLPLLYPEYLTDVVLSQKLVRNSLECRDLVDEAKDFHLLPHRRELISRSRTKPRSGHHVQGSIYAVGGLTKTGDSMSTVEVYDPQMKRWRMAEAMTMMRSRVGVAVMDGKLYAIGGYNGFDRLNTVEVYDSKLKQWKRVKSMHYRRSAVGAAALNGYLYVCGGYDGSISLNVVERYLAATDEWENVTPMNIKRSAAGIVSLDGYIYALGGHDGLMIFNSVERYDPKTDQWEFVEPMLSRRCRLGVAAFGGKIYVCGGYDGCIFLQTAEVFDPQTGKWSAIAKMRMTRSRVALVANCAKLFAIGGYDGITNLSSVETYDIENNFWEMAPSMVAHEGGVGVGVIPDNY